MSEWPTTFRELCRRKSEPDYADTLLSNRARALIRGFAAKEADGTSQGSLKLMQDMLLSIEAEIEREYETALMRHVRLREVIDGC